MRTSRRWRAVTAAAVLLAGSALAACGGGDDESAGGAGDGSGDGTTPDLPECPVDALEGAEQAVEVVVWHTQQAKSLETLEALADEYNASQDAVRVRLEAQGNSFEELQRKFEAAIPSEGLPDVLVFDDTSTQLLADSGVILPAQSCLDASGGDTGDLLPVAVDYYTIDGVLWPASANLGGVLMYYNRDHFEDAGLDPDDPPGTLAELRETAEALKAAGASETPVIHEFASWKTEFWLTGANAPIVDNENGRGGGETTAGAVADDPAALELFQWFADMQADGLLLAVPKTEGSIDHFLAMAEENGSILIESSSAATSVEAFLAGDLDPDSVEGEIDPSAASGLRIGAAPLPRMEEGGHTQMGGSAWYLTSTSSPERQAAAWDFMQFMNTPETQARMLTGGSYLPYVPAANDLPEVQEFYESGLSGPWLAIANADVQEIDPDYPGPLIGPYYDVRKAIEAAHDRLMIDGDPPQQVVDDLQAAITDALTTYNEGGF